MAKTITAKELTVSKEIWDRLNRAHKPGSPSLLDILADDGKLQARESYGLAILMIKSFKDIIELDALIEKSKHIQAKHFSTVMIGFAISYALGDFDFDLSGPAPFAIPNMNTHKLEESDFVTLRNGATLDTKKQLLPFLIGQFNEDRTSTVFESVYPKGRFGGRKEPQPVNLVNALRSMMHVVDKLDETRFN